MCVCVRGGGAGGMLYLRPGAKRQGVSQSVGRSGKVQPLLIFQKDVVRWAGGDHHSRTCGDLMTGEGEGEQV